MIVIVPINNLVSFKLGLGPNVSGIGKLGWGGREPSQDQIEELSVPWQELLPDASLFSLLSWHSRISDFAGRDAEMDELRQWAESDYPVRVKFVVGDGGIGKSRLGGEFADSMRNKDWAAGFVDLRKPRAFSMKKAGTLLIIDYPEENTNSVKELLKDLTFANSTEKLRVLFLTRQSLEYWEGIIADANARNIVDYRPIVLRRLDVTSSKEIYDSTIIVAGKHLQEDSVMGPGLATISTDAMAAWLEHSPENQRALFIMAAAVHSAENPDAEVIDFSGREVVQSLVIREVDRYQRLADSLGIGDRDALSRLLAMAAIAEELSVSDVKVMIDENDLPLGFKADEDFEGKLIAAGLLADGKVKAPQPDIVAAALVVHVIAKSGEHAPELVWAALEGDVQSSLERIGRLSYDAEVVLGIQDPSLSNWMAEAADGNEVRCAMLEPHIIESPLPLGWLKTAINVCRTLLKQEIDDSYRAGLLNNLGGHLTYSGNMDEALEAIRSAVDIRRRQAKADLRFEPNLGACLNNLSNALADKGDTVEALKIGTEAVEIFRRLAVAEPDQFEAGLSKCLHSLSVRLSTSAHAEKALLAAQEAVDISRRYSKTDPTHENKLANHLNRLSNALSDTGKMPECLAAIKEAVQILRSLAATDPARFESDLSICLHNFARRLSDVGDLHAGFAAIKEAADINRRLTEANPIRFQEELGADLLIMAVISYELGEISTVPGILREAIQLLRAVTERQPGSVHESHLKDAEVMLTAVLKEIE